MRSLRAGEQDRPFDLGACTHDAAVAQPAPPSHVGARAEHDVAADPDRSLDDDSWLNPAALANRDPITREMDLG